MKQITGVLIDFGMAFEYENFGSDGEKVVSFEADVEVWRQDGKFTFEHSGERTELDERLGGAENQISVLVEKACIEETT